MDPNTPNSFHPQSYRYDAPGYGQDESLQLRVIIGLVLAFVVPPVGIILGLRALKRGTSGANETLSRASIVLGGVMTIVFGILLAIGISNYLRAQTAARDARTQSASIELQSAVITYRLGHGSYPTTAQMQDSSWSSTNLTTGHDDLFASDTIHYRATPEGCNGTEAHTCTGFIITLDLSTGSKELKSVPYTRATDDD